MKFLRCVFLLQLATTLALGQPAHESNSRFLPNHPEALVQSLYTEVVTRHPAGIPQGADMKVFAPYLSKSLLQRVDLFLACYADWLRQNPDPNTKPPFGVFESGIFSGSNERTEPRTFHVEKAQAQKDGSFRVYVSLAYEDPPGHSQTWRVAAIVVLENGHFVVDDVIYLKDKETHVQSRLSGGLSYQCDGARWVGYGDRQKDLKQ